MEWRSLHNDELDVGMYCSPNIIQVIKSRRWTGHVARMGGAAYRVFLGKPEGKQPLGRPRYRWRIIVKGIFKKRDGGYGMD